MFRHIFYYRLLSGLRDKQTLFWAFLFPIILATLFSFAFADLNADEVFNQVKIAVVENEVWEQDMMFQQVIEQLSEGENALFSTQILSAAEAESLLQNNEIVGYIIPDSTLEVVIRYSGLRQSMLKVFADEYMQTSSTITKLMQDNPGIDVRTLMPDTSNLVVDKPASSSAPDNTFVYYYALIAMACLYGGFWGFREVTAAKANLSAQGARICVSPVSKLRQFLYAMSAAFLIHFASILVLLLYLTQIIGVNFGDQIGYILLASLIGSSLGVSIGALICVVGNHGEGVKSAILIGFSMLMSFFSGLMIADMKYIVNKSFPLLRWINPANLISDAFYSLYYYETLQRYWQNVAAMLILQLVISTAIVMIMRRQRYASI